MAIDFHLDATPKAVSLNMCSYKSFQIPNLPRKDGAIGLLGRIVEFEDGSQWKLTKALSPVKYQQDVPPFEGRQVFECVCINDPNNCHPSVQEAVAKVKYQVRGTADSIIPYLSQAWRCREEYEEKRGTEEQEKALDDYNYYARLYEMATTPVDTPHKFTTEEMEALEIFGKAKCTSVPHLIEYWEGYVPVGVDNLAIAGGYMKIIFMNKLPGESLDREKFLNKTEEMRDTIRRGFKAALMEIWKCALDPEDRNLRNLVWDEKENKCYIVDFEDYAVLEQVPNDPEKVWYEDEYELWGLAEECREH